MFSYILRQNSYKVVKSQFSHMPIEKKRKDTGVIAIQVASFRNFETAKMFANFINNRVGYAEVGSPRIIESRPN